MPAYKVKGDWGEEICFYPDQSEADCWWDEVIAHPAFDQYEDLGYVPTEAFIADGWFLYCDECNRRSDGDDDDDESHHNSKPISHVFYGHFYFCHPDCEGEWRKERDRAKAEKQAQLSEETS